MPPDTPYDILEALNNARSKSGWLNYAHKCCESHVYLNAAMEQLLYGTPAKARYPAEIIRLVSDMCPQLIVPFAADLLLKLKSTNHQGEMRGMLHVFQRMPIPESIHGEIYYFCLPLIRSNKHSIAVRVFAMTTAYNVAKSYPELYAELKGEIEPIIALEGPAFKSRGTKILNRTWK